MRAGHKVSMAVNLYFTESPDPQGILEQQLRPRQIHALNIIIIILIIYIILYY